MTTKHINLARRLYQPSVETVAANVHTIGTSLVDYFNALAVDLNLSNTDDLLHALAASEVAVRKLRVRLVADIEAEKEQD